MIIRQTFLIFVLLTMFFRSVDAAIVFVDIAGTNQTGSLAATNFKNWNSSADALAPNGLPDYPVFKLPTGPFWTSVISTPLSSSKIYQYELEGATLLNKSISDSDYATRSAGSISYDDAVLTGIGTEFIGVSSVGININGLNFSSVNSGHNGGSGFGNAPLEFAISTSNLTGSGLTFINGQLTSIDLVADVSILPSFQFGANNFPFTTVFSQAQSLAITGNQFAFDFDVTTDAVTPFITLDDARIVFNRSGLIDAVAAVPEPSSIALLGVVAVSIGCYIKLVHRGRAIGST